MIRARTPGRAVPATGQPSGPLPVVLDIQEVATHLNVTIRHVRRLVFERRIPYIKVGNLLRFDPEEIAAWLRECEVPQHRR